MDNQPSESFAPGSVRNKNAEGTWIVTPPNSPMYSTATMLAEEWWDTKTSQWKRIFED